MLKVWRGKSRIFAECSACGCYGTVGHLEIKRRLTPEIAEALERHEAHMLALRSHYTAAANNIAKQIKNGSMRRPDGVAKIRSLYENHVAQVRLGAAQLPRPEGKVAEFIEKCPWCDHVDTVDVVALADDKAEPDFELAKPVKEYLAKQAAAAKPKAKQGA